MTKILNPIIVFWAMDKPKKLKKLSVRGLESPKMGDPLISKASHIMENLRDHLVDQKK